jgi:hypothetical protein
MGGVCCISWFYQRWSWISYAGLDRGGAELQQAIHGSGGRQVFGNAVENIGDPGGSAGGIGGKIGAIDRIWSRMAVSMESACFFHGGASFREKNYRIFCQNQGYIRGCARF